MSRVLNIAQRLRLSAERSPHQLAVVFPAHRDAQGRAAYTHLTFRQLDRESDRLARGLREMGVRPGMRLVLMVRPGLEFITLTFALFKAGAVAVLIDPGMGRANIFRCLAEVEPDGFVAVPVVHLLRTLYRRRFPRAKFNVTTGKTGWGGCLTYRQLLGDGWAAVDLAATAESDPAAIIFTSGSTGPPKGVVYEHGMFDAQVDLLRDYYQIRPGEFDLSGFPLFALFNAAMGVTTVVPDMDPTRPAQVDPRKVLEAVSDFGITQAFGSPAIWNRVGRHCESSGEKMPSLKRVLSAGAPVPLHVLERMTRILPAEADIHTPYGATEALPVCSIGGREVLAHTAARTRRGAGTCVGRPFPRLAVKVIRIAEGPIGSLADAVELPLGEIGEIIVRGPSVTREYFRRPEATALAKIADGESLWHRMGDVGYLDEEGRLWFCGRKAHVVETVRGLMFTIPCEAIFNEHPRVYRSALVGIGARPNQQPVIIVEPEAGQYPRNRADESRLRAELLELGAASPLTAAIRTVLFHPSLPVDIRHNVKIFREKLAPWAAKRLSKARGGPI